MTGRRKEQEILWGSFIRVDFRLAPSQWETSLYPRYTGAATFVPPLCDHKTGRVTVEGRKEVERLTWSFKGGTQDVQTSPWTPWSPWSLEHVQTVAQGRRGGRLLTGRPKEAWRRHTHRRARRMDAQWSAIGRPVKMRTVMNIVHQFERGFCLPCTTPLADHWEITVATTVPPFGDHGNPCATLAMVLPPLCLLCATWCATSAALVVQGRHRDRAAAVTQKQNFLGFGDHWAS